MSVRIMGVLLAGSRGRIVAGNASRGAAVGRGEGPGTGNRIRIGSGVSNGSDGISGISGIGGRGSEVGA
ncbi:hypothetical protein GCM10010505_36520 [Kitasatospora aburaviensis]